MDIKRTQPDKWLGMVKVAARKRLEGASWIVAGRESGISSNTLISWHRKSTSRAGITWRSILEREASANGTDTDGKPLEHRLPEVQVSGFRSPEEFCDHWSLEAARVQVETMVNPSVPRRERLDASKRVQDIGGHSPVNKSMVITAPLDDPKLASVLMSVLREVKELRSETVLIETSAS